MSAYLNRKSRRPLTSPRVVARCLAAVGMLALAELVVASPQYKCELLKEVEGYPGAYEPGAINDAGEVAGILANDGADWVINWNKQRQGGVLARDNGAIHIQVKGINSNGVVAGTSFIAPTPVASKWLADGTAVELWRHDQWEETLAFAINDLGVIAGAAGQESDWVDAVLWTDSGRTRLPSLESGRSAYAFGLNNHGVVVGRSDKTFDDWWWVPQAVQWQDGKLSELGALPGMIGSTALSINDHGLIVGWSFDGLTESSDKPVAWVRGVIRPLQVATDAHGVAVAVNQHGEIIGATSDMGSTYWADWRAAPQKLVDLVSVDRPCRNSNGRRVALDRAFGINSHGVIVASGTWKGGSAAFRLVPVQIR